MYENLYERLSQLEIDTTFQVRLLLTIKYICARAPGVTCLDKIFIT